jgi:hypothetical protein
MPSGGWQSLIDKTFLKGLFQNFFLEQNVFNFFYTVFYGTVISNFFSEKSKKQILKTFVSCKLKTFIRNIQIFLEKHLDTWIKKLFVTVILYSGKLEQEILKGEVSLYRRPPAWLVWNQLYEYWQFLFLFAKQTNPNQSNRRSTVQWYFPL